MFLRFLNPLLLATTAALAVSCDSGGGEGRGGQQQNLRTQIEKQFPFSAQQPLRTIYACRRDGSSLDYDYDFYDDFEYEIRLVDGSSQEVTLKGGYHYDNGELSLDAVDTHSFFPEKLLEKKIFLGMIVEFSTYVDAQGFDPNRASMVCYAVGHHYHDAASEFYRQYDCPGSNSNGIVTTNHFEFTPKASVHQFRVVPGGIARFREIDNVNLTEPLKRFGFGVYRRSGDRFYGYLYNQFDDFNLVSGSFTSGDQQITVEQDAGKTCQLRI